MHILWKTVQEAEHTTASNAKIPMESFFLSKFPMDLLQNKKREEEVHRRYRCKKKLPTSGDGYAGVHYTILSTFDYASNLCDKKLNNIVTAHPP